MTTSLVKTFLLSALLLVSVSCSSEDEGFKRPKVWPKPTEPPPASPIYHDVVEQMPGEEEIERDAAGRNARLEQRVESALRNGDMLERETVFVHVLPELLQVEPRRLVDLHARLEPGDARERLRTEIARLWASTDAAAATQWMKSLEEGEGRAAAMVAVTALAPWDPRGAVALAGDFDLENEARVRKLLRTLAARERASAAN